MVAVAARRREENGALPESSRLALHAFERRAVIDYEVVARVFAERDEEGVASTLERQHNGQRGSIAFGLQVINHNER